jgi:hypothetical protein
MRGSRLSAVTGTFRSTPAVPLASVWSRKDGVAIIGVVTTGEASTPMHRVEPSASV